MDKKYLTGKPLGVEGVMKKYREMVERNYRSNTKTYAT